MRGPRAVVSGSLKEDHTFYHFGVLSSILRDGGTKLSRMLIFYWRTADRHIVRFNTEDSLNEKSWC